MAKSTSYLGTGWGFPPTFLRDQKTRLAERGRVVMVSNEEDICQALKILFNTSLGERVMQPGYGADLKSHVFEPMNATVLTFIEDPAADRDCLSRAAHRNRTVDGHAQPGRGRAADRNRLPDSRHEQPL